MKITNPTALSLQVRPYRWRGQSRIGLTLSVLVDSSDLTPVLETETTLWETVQATLDSEGVLDYGIPKVNPEFLVSGNAYTTFADAKNQVDVTVQVNDKQRTLRVFGDREYKNNKINEAADFEQMPMTWAHSYGGGDFVNNPNGRGWIDGRSHQPSDMVLLPNVENPSHLIIDPRKEHLSYNFGPQSMFWPIRFEKIGSYSEEWKTKEFPGFPLDMDPSIFNTAQPDQVWSDSVELPPNTKFAVTNMHPKRACWQGIVPAWRGRCLVKMQRSPESEPIIQEAFLSLKTLWLIPHLEKYVLIFQDSVPCWYEDGSELRHALAALEWRHSPKEQAHYLRFMSLREDPDTSALEAYADEDLLPENIQYKGLEPAPTSLGPMSEKLSKLQHYMRTITREHLSSMGLEADYYLPEEVGPQPRSDLRYLAEQQRWQDQRIEQMRQHFNEVKEARKRYLVSGGVDKELNDLTDIDGFYERLEKEEPKVKEGDSSSRLMKLTQMQEHHSGSTDERMQRLEKRMWTLSAHFEEGRYVLSSQPDAQDRQALLDRIEAGESLEGLNLSYADLSDLHLSNLDLSLVLFKRANLSRTTFEHCRFDESALSFAVLDKTQFKDCHFKSSNLNQSRFKDVTFERCVFEKLIVHDLSLSQSHFEQCQIKESIWQNSQVMATTFRQCVADGYVLLNNRIEQCRFDECEWTRCTVTQCQIMQTDFDDNYLYRMAFTYADLVQVSFASSWLEAVSIVSEEPLSHINLSDSYIKNSCLRNLNFRSCRFDSAIIENTECSLSSFKHVSAVGMETPDALFLRARFEDVDFTGANLTNAIFTHAEFSAVNFTRVNFFRCDMAHTVVNSDCIEHENYMKQIQLEPSQREDNHAI